MKCKVAATQMPRTPLLRVGGVAVVTLLLCCPIPCSAQERVPFIANEELQFEPQPQRGYVFKLAHRMGRITVHGDVTISDVDRVRRHGGVWRGRTGNTNDH